MKQPRGRPQKLDGFRHTKLKGRKFYHDYGEAGFSFWPKIDFVTGSKLVYERHMLMERGGVAWITNRTERAVTGWQERGQLRPVKQVGHAPLFDIGDVA